MEHQKTQVIAIIPARYESNRFRGKPLAAIAGKPMIQHVVERAQQVELLSRVIVATDDNRICDCVQSFGGEYVLTRSDHVSGSDRLAEAAERLGISDTMSSSISRAISRCLRRRWWSRSPGPCSTTRRCRCRP